MHHQQLFLARSTHHFDRSLIAIHKDFPARIKQENRIRAPLEQLPEHGFIVTQRGPVGTGPFVPFKLGGG